LQVQRYDDPEKLDKLVEQVRSTDQKSLQQRDHSEKIIREMLDRFVQHTHTREQTYFQQLADSRYDDTTIQKKLDKLMEQIHLANSAAEKLDVVEQIHTHVARTAEYISNMLEVRTHRVEVERGSTARSLREALKNLQITRNELAVAQAENARIEGIINSLCSIGGMGKTAIKSAGTAAAGAAENLAMQQFQTTESHTWGGSNYLTSSNYMSNSSPLTSSNSMTSSSPNLGHYSLTSGTTHGHPNRYLDLQDLFVQDVREIDTPGNLYGENNTVLGKVDSS
jgi:hypothetical protein